MKTGFTLVLAASLLARVSGSPAMAKVGSESTIIASRWAAERQAVALIETIFEAKGQGIAPAERDEITRLESQWAARAPQDSPLLNNFARAQQPLDHSSRPQSGYISVHRNDSHGPFIGFLAVNKIVDTRKEAVKYTIAEPDRSATHIDVADSSQRMCVAVGPFGEFIGPSLKAFHLARHAPKDKVEAGPHWSLELNAFIMTSAFSLNRASKEITARWINPDGDSPRTMIAMAHQRVFYTGDVSLFQEVAGFSAEVVTFNWVEIRTE